MANEMAIISFYKKSLRYINTIRKVLVMCVVDNALINETAPITEIVDSQIQLNIFGNLQISTQV